MQDVRSAGIGDMKLTHTARSIGRRTELELAGRDRAYWQVDPVAVIWQQFDRWLQSCMTQGKVGVSNVSVKSSIMGHDGGQWT